MTKDLEVLLVTPTLRVGGNERQIVNLAKVLSEKNIGVTVCCLVDEGPLANEARSYGIDVITTGRRGRFDPGQIGRVSQIIASKGIMIVHSFRFGANLWGRLAGIIKRVPVLIASKRNVFTPKTFLQRRLDHFLMRYTDIMAVNAQAVKDYLVSYEDWSPEKICVIHNGIDYHVFQDPQMSNSQSVANIRSEWKLSSHGPVVLQMCRFSPQKKIETFLEAVKLVSQKIPSVSYVLAGTSKIAEEQAYDQVVRKKINSLGLENVVSLVGEVPAKRALSVADMVVQTSSREGLPNVILEAMAAGKPVIATDAGGTRECVADGKTGFIVSVGDSEAVARRIIELLKDADKRKQFGQRAQELVKTQFSLDKLGSETKRMYFRALASSKR